MSDEHENKSGYQAQSSETIHAQSSEAITGSGSGIAPDMDYVRPAELPEQDLYHPHSFIEKWVFCQDAKVIGVQYFLTAVFTGIVGLILSWLMRLQLGFPGLAGFITAEHYYQFVTMHGMIMVVFNSTIFRRIWKLSYSFNGRSKRHGLPICEYVKFLDVFCCCCSFNG